MGWGWGTSRAAAAAVIAKVGGGRGGATEIVNGALCAPVVVLSRLMRLTPGLALGMGSLFSDPRCRVQWLCSDAFTS